MPRRGISLIKLIVIIAIIAILIGLLLPAVQKVREAAQRTKCANQLRLIGIAMHNYHADFSHFPPVCDFGPGAATGHGLASAFFRLLPYLEQTDVAKRFNEKKPATYYDGEAAPAKAAIATYVCPSDTSEPKGQVGKIDVSAPGAAPPFVAEFTGRFATGSYAANGNALGTERSVEKFTDGTSNTTLTAERFQVCKTVDGGQVLTHWALGAFSASTPSYALAPPEADKYPRTTNKGLDLAQFSPSAVTENDPSGTTVGREIRFSAIAKSADAPAGFQVRPLPGKCDPRIPQSPHANGMSVGFADGSVRFLRASIKANLFWAMATPEGGEPLTVPD